MSRRGGTLDNCISNGAHRSQGTPANGPRSRSRSQCNPLQNPEQLHSLVKLELGRRQAGGGRDPLWASCRHVCLIKPTRRCRLPCLLSAIAGADVAYVVPGHMAGSCWQARCERPFRQLLGPTHLSTEKQTNRQSDGQTDDATTNSICNREAGTGITMLQQQQPPGRGRGRRALICVCVPHREKSCSPAESIEIFFFCTVPPEVHLVT